MLLWKVSNRSLVWTGSRSDHIAASVLSLVTSTVPLQWKEASIHPILKTTAQKPEAYLHPISITAILEWNYNGNKTDVARVISFRFKIFRFRFLLFWCALDSTQLISARARLLVGLSNALISHCLHCLSRFNLLTVLTVR